MIQAQQNHDTAIWISADHYVMTCMAEVASRPNSDEGALSSRLLIYAVNLVSRLRIHAS